MRKYDIPYVKNEKNYYPPVDYRKMGLQELKKKYIDMCGKSGGLLSNCSKCEHPCQYGERAMQLLANEVYDEPHVPLYGGKTLIERAKEENMKRRAEKEQTMENQTTKVAKDGRQNMDGWYEMAVASGDPVAWVMKQFNMTKTKARSKIYSWRYRHPEDKAKDEIEMPVLKDEPVKEEPVAKEEFIGNENIESKMEALMKTQEQYKAEMIERQRLYEEAKAKYEAISKKIDILCSAMDILNDD